ncbi:Hypothetical protein NocV09_09000150 [Nannochloropsis oceanica]
MIILTFCPLLLLVFLTPANADLALLPTRDAARRMTWAQLDQIFKEGTIDEGIPEGFSYGYGLVNPSYPGFYQRAADMFWNGKRFEAKSGENCHGRDCGQKGVVFNYLSVVDHVNWQEIPGAALIGQLKDGDPSLAPLQLDDKPSVLIDYHRVGGSYDELRLVNSKERIYLGRGLDWLMPEVLAYFVIQFYDTPERKELALGTRCYYQARESARLAAGTTEGSNREQILQATPENSWKWEGLDTEGVMTAVTVGMSGGGDTSCPEMLERLGERLRGAVRSAGVNKGN